MDSHPKMLFKAPGPYEMHGGKFDYLIVADEGEEQKALATGWRLTTTEALQPFAPTEKDDDAPATRDELKAKADELGLEYPKNIPTDRLAEMVEEALKAKE